VNDETNTLGLSPVAPVETASGYPDGSGSTAYVGHQPVVSVRTIEQTKYETMWAHAQYRVVAPGEDVAPIFLAQARPAAGAEVIDFGAGTGRGALLLAMMAGVKVHMLDFAANCLDADIREIVNAQPHFNFTQHDLTQPVPIQARYGYCTDVMEHIPPHQVDIVLRNVLQAAEHVFFQISCVDDSCGKLIGDELHLSVHDYAWWLKKLQQFDVAVHWSEDKSTHCMFYVTSWQPGDALVDAGEINVPNQTILQNVEANLAANWMELRPYEINNNEILLLAGGPSLNDFEDEIRWRQAQGANVVTLNNAYHWAVSRGITVGCTVVVDAREHNARFTHPVVDKTQYLIASQCHPSVLEGLPRDRTFLWHTTAMEIRDLLNRHRKIWYGVPGGSTVALRAIPLLRMLGFQKFRCYGWDSCLIDGKSHAYEQSENDEDYICPVTVGNRVFRCTVWMASQAHEFMNLIRYYGDEVQLEIAGDGLLAHILLTGAQMFDEQQAKDGSESQTDS
jgi:hypothetical protein